MFLIDRESADDKKKYSQYLTDRYLSSINVSELGYDTDDMVDKYRQKELMDRSREHIIGEENPNNTIAFNRTQRMNALEYGSRSALDRPDHSEMFLGSYERERTVAESMQIANAQNRVKLQNLHDRNKLSDLLSDANVVDPLITEYDKRQSMNMFRSREAQRYYKQATERNIDYENTELRTLGFQRPKDHPSISNFENSAALGNELETRNDFGKLYMVSNRNGLVNKLIETDRKDKGFADDDVVANFGTTVFNGKRLKSDIEMHSDRTVIIDDIATKKNINYSQLTDRGKVHEIQYENDMRNHQFNNQGAFKVKGELSYKLITPNFESDLRYKSYNDKSAFQVDYESDTRAKDITKEYNNITPLQTQLTQSEIRALGLMRNDSVGTFYGKENTNIKDVHNYDYKSLLSSVNQTVKLKDSIKIDDIRKYMSTDGNNDPIYIKSQLDSILHESNENVNHNVGPNPSAQIEKMVREFQSDTKNKNKSFEVSNLYKTAKKVADYSSIRINEVSDNKNNANNASIDKIRSENIRPIKSRPNINVYDYANSYN